MSLPARPGERDAWRATAGAVCAYAMALVLAAFVGALGGAGERSAGAERAQLAVQALLFAGGAFLFVDGLRLAHRPRDRDPLTSAAEDPPPRIRPLEILAGGFGAATGAWIVGPAVARVFPGLHDQAVPVDRLGLGSGLLTDLGTVVVIVGLAPLAEELLFRGVVAGAWLRAGRPVRAILISSLLFGLAHFLVGPRTVVVALLLGLLFGGVYLLTSSLGAPVLAHAITNALALVGAGLDGTVPIVAMLVTTTVVTVAATIASPFVAHLPRLDTLHE